MNAETGFGRRMKDDPSVGTFSCLNILNFLVIFVEPTKFSLRGKMSNRYRNKNYATLFLMKAFRDLPRIVSIEGWTTYLFINTYLDSKQ